MTCSCYLMLLWRVIKEVGVGGDCDTYGGKEVWWGNLMERDHLEDLAILGWMIPKWILKELVVRLGNF